MTQCNETAEDTMLTMDEFLAKHDILMRVLPVETNPFVQNKKWDAFHYNVTLYWGPRYVLAQRPIHNRLSTFYSMGKGHVHERTKRPKYPTIAEVLDSLAMEACDANNYTLDEWLEAFGYVDTRANIATFNQLQETAKQLKQLLGNDAYNELLYKVGRL